MGKIVHKTVVSVRGRKRHRDCHSILKRESGPEKSLAGIAFILALIIMPARLSWAQGYDSVLPESLIRAGDDNTVAELSCSLSLLDFLANEGPLEKLANPQLIAVADIQKRIDECRIIEQNMRSLAVLDTLLAETGLMSSPDSQRQLSIFKRRNEILMLASNFIVFAHEWSATKSYIIGNKIILQMPRELGPDDRAYILEKAERIYDRILDKWNAFGLDAPRGFIFIRVFSKLQEIQDEFYLDEKAHGATFPCRFVAVPWDQGRIEFKTTLAHELVHVLTNVLLGYGRRTGMPLWAEEGLATYLSQDPGVHLVSCKTYIDLQGNRIKQTTYSSTSDEYMKWKSYFMYMAVFYGKDKLGRFVQDSLRNASVSQSFFTAFSLPDAETFFMNADRWLQRRERLKFFLILSGFLGIMGFLFFSMRSSIKGLVGGLILFSPAVVLSFSRYFRQTTIFPWLAVSIAAAFIALIVISVIGSRRGGVAVNTPFSGNQRSFPDGGQEYWAAKEISFRQAVELDPHNADAYDNLGNCINNQGRFAEAERAYRVAISLNPINPEYHADLAGVLFEQDKFDEARSEAREALRLGFRGEHWIFEALSTQGLL